MTLASQEEWEWSAAPEPWGGWKPSSCVIHWRRQPHRATGKWVLTTTRSSRTLHPPRATVRPCCEAEGQDCSKSWMTLHPHGNSGILLHQLQKGRLLLRRERSDQMGSQRQALGRSWCYMNSPWELGLYCSVLFFALHWSLKMFDDSYSTLKNLHSNVI